MSSLSRDHAASHHPLRERPQHLWELSPPAGLVSKMWRGLIRLQEPRNGESLPPVDVRAIFACNRLLLSLLQRLREVKKHVTHSHDKKVSERSGKFSMVFTDVSKHASYTTAISALGEVFMRKAQIRDEVFYLTVMYVGPLKNSAKYKYTFTLNKKNAVESVTVCQRTRSFTENCDDVFRSRNCVKLHYDVVSDFMLDNNDLPNVMEITRV
ncbi:hypothetical protein C0J52_19742 [Blattella germanica]|nr:hypothetical protein C0J52_19742 [Blattella germanica]